MSEAGGIDSTAGARGAWESYWFAEASLVRLAAFRIAMMAAAYYALFQFRAGVMQHADGLAEAWVQRDWNPIYLLELLRLGPPGPMLARSLFWILYCAILCGLIGLWTRASSTLVALLLTYWIAVAYSFGKPHHDCIALVLGLWTLPLAPAGARLSLDAWWGARRAAARGAACEPAQVAPWAALPLRFTAITIALGYFFAGATKLTVSGLEWMNGYTLQAHMLSFDAPWSSFFSRNVALVRLMSIGLIAVQVFFPLVLFLPVTRWFFLPMAIVFHLIAWATMDTGPFLTLWFPFAAFLPWETFPARGRSLLRTGPVTLRITYAMLLIAAMAGVGRIYFRFFPTPATAGLASIALLATWLALNRAAGGSRSPGPHRSG